MGYNIQYRKTPGSKQTQLVFGPNPGKVMKALKMFKKGKGQGTSEEPIFLHKSSDCNFHFFFELFLNDFFFTSV